MAGPSVMLNLQTETMPDDPLDALPPHDRRRFFAAGLARLVAPLADYLQSRLPVEESARPNLLRPPGAIEEEAFLRTCYRCGSCAESCPVSAILILHSRDEELQGTPYLNPHQAACVLCEELACMAACPSGALRRRSRLEVRIGIARLDEVICLRSRGEDCRVCVEACPLGEAAISIDDRGRIRITEPRESGPGCVGCGLCQQQCPVRPIRAIRVAPSVRR